MAGDEGIEPPLQGFGDLPTSSYLISQNINGKKTTNKTICQNASCFITIPIKEKS